MYLEQHRKESLSRHDRIGWDQSSRLLAAVVAVVSTLLSAPVSWGAEAPKKKEPSFPSFFKVYSTDGKESLTGSCGPAADYGGLLQSSEDLLKLNKALCKFVHVRIESNADKPSSIAPIVTFDEAVIQYPELQAELTDPAALKKAQDEWRKGQEAARQSICQRPKGGNKSTIDEVVERQARSQVAGPKRKRWAQELAAACSEKDPTDFFRKFVELEKRTCDLWVDTFDLEFRRVSEGQWIFQQEAPGLLSKVVTVYELTEDKNGFTWTLTETRIPTKGSDEKPIQTVWTFDGFSEFELPCDFISHNKVQARF